MTKQLLTCLHGLYSGGRQHSGLLKHSLLCSSETSRVKPEARHCSPHEQFLGLLCPPKGMKKKKLEKNKCVLQTALCTFLPLFIVLSKYFLSSASYCSADISFDDKSTNHTCLVTFTPEESMSLWTWIIPVSVMV